MISIPGTLASDMNPVYSIIRQNKILKEKMSILQGEPPSPTFRSIFGGIALGIVLLLAFFNLPVLVKYTGAVLTFIPGKLGLIQVVKSNEVISVDFAASPTTIAFKKPGNYALYTDNYDLLIIHDAIVESGGKAWLKIETEIGENIDIKLISRGMAFYDTLLAKGRPVAIFTIAKPGAYIMKHPTRPTTAYVVPDYTSGNENWIKFLLIAELVILVIVIRDIRGALRARKKKQQS